MVLQKLLSATDFGPNSLYIFISSSCIIGFLFGLFNWYRVTSIVLENGEITPDTKQIDANTLAKLIDYNKKIAKVTYNLINFRVQKNSYFGNSFILPYSSWHSRLQFSSSKDMKFSQ
jgi:hypothetical protein